MSRHFNTDFNKAAIPQAQLTAACKYCTRPTKEPTRITWRNVIYIYRFRYPATGRGGPRGSG